MCVVRNRLLVAAVLVVVGSAVVILAASVRGLPWEFGPRAAVILEVMGDCELQPVEGARRRLTDVDELMPGDRVSVGVLSFARLSIPSGTAELDARSTASLAGDVVTIESGRVELDLVKSVTLECEKTKSTIRVSAGRYLAQAGGGTFGVLVREGTAVQSKVVARKGDLLVAGKDEVLKPAAVAPIALTRTGAVFRGTAPQLTQVVVNGAIVGYPDARGALELDASASDANVVLARDAFDRVVPVVIDAEDPKKKPRKRRSRRR